MEIQRELNLKELFFTLLHRIWLVILCAVVAGAAFFAYTWYCVTPMYTASVSIYVNNAVSGYVGEGISASDLETSQQLVATYTNILKSDMVLDKVSEEIKEDGLNYTGPEIRKMMSAGSIEQTEMFRVYITNANPNTATTIVNTIAEIAPDEIGNIMDRSSTKIIDYAKVPKAPSSPNLMKNTALGIIGGALIAIVIITFQFLMDVRIHDELDLAQISDAPVLGVIPSFDLGKIKFGYESEAESVVDSEVKKQ